MNIHTIHHLTLGPAVMNMQLDPVRHVVGDIAVLQVDIAAGRVYIETIATVTGDVGVGDGDGGGGQGDVDTWRGSK